MPSDQLATSPTAKDQDIETFRLRHAYSPVADLLLHNSRAAYICSAHQVTAYDEDGYFIPNAIERQAIGDRDKLIFNADGSLDLYLQAESPGADKEGNWLPLQRGPSTC